MAAVRSNPITAAIRARRANPYPPLQVANGVRADRMPGPQVVNDAAGELVKAAWLPLVPGQVVPMLGEAVADDESCFDE